MTDRLAAAKAMPIADVAARLGIAGLRPAGAERVGPCPRCGGRDRFAINPRRDVFLCRRCPAGGDQVALVQHALGLDFRPALDWLVGPQQADPDPARAAEIEADLRRREAERAAEEQRARAAARDAAVALWRVARAGADSPAAAYLRTRGLAPDPWPKALRYVDSAPYLRAPRLHSGPAMVAAIQGADGLLAAVHLTYLDPRPPHGKARIGDGQPAKLVKGNKKGGAIRLRTPAGATEMIVGEGIETTLSAAAASPGAACWCAVDLGNMSGRMRPGHPGEPDLDDAEAFVPPPWVRRLVFLQDMDSDPDRTRDRLLAGLRRAALACPDLETAIACARPGGDFNDMRA